MTANEADFGTCDGSGSQTAANHPDIFVVYYFGDAALLLPGRGAAAYLTKPAWAAYRHAVTHRHHSYCCWRANQHADCIHYPLPNSNGEHACQSAATDANPDFPVPDGATDADLYAVLPIAHACDIAIRDTNYHPPNEYTFASNQYTVYPAVVYTCPRTRNEYTSANTGTWHHSDANAFHQTSSRKPVTVRPTWAGCG